MTMIEILQTIALLCTVSAGGDTNSIGWVHKKVDKYQLECQKYYVNCFEKYNNLTKCVLERKVD